MIETYALFVSQTPLPFIFGRHHSVLRTFVWFVRLFGAAMFASFKDDLFGPKLVVERFVNDLPIMIAWLLGYILVSGHHGLDRTR
jgi:hypothetical protein